MENAYGGSLTPDSERLFSEAVVRHAEGGPAAPRELTSTIPSARGGVLAKLQLGAADIITA